MTRLHRSVDNRYRLVALACMPLLGAQDAPREASRPLRAIEPAIGVARTADEDHSFLGGSHASGDWAGIRPWLRDRGILLEAYLLTDASLVAGGGMDPGRAVVRSLLDVALTLETEPLFGIAGGHLFADFQLQRGPDGSRDVGDLQVYSNIDGEDRTQLAQIWYEQALFEDYIWIKLGKADANTDFAYVDHGARFINSSFGFSPTTLGFPTYPDPSFGAALFVRPTDGVYAGAGVYDGATNAGIPTGTHGPRTLFGPPSDLFVVTEFGLRWTDAVDIAPGRIGFGIWRHTGDFTTFDSTRTTRAAGGYVVADQILWRPAEAASTDRGLASFLQLGWADSEISPIAFHFGTGLTWTGPFNSRPADALGIAATWARFTNAPGAPLRGEGELALECFYTLQSTPWMRLKADVQWIVDPGGSGLDDALVFTLRSAVSF